MKKINIIAMLSVILLAGCVNENDDYNKDSGAPYAVPAETLLTNAQKQWVDQMTTPSVNLNVIRFFMQYWAATQYTTESRYRITTRTIPDNVWEELFRDALGNFEAAKQAVGIEVRPTSISESDWTIKQANKIAIIEIQEVYIFQTLVDEFGDIPYSQALNPTIILPKYDDDASIYPQLVTRLDAAIANLNTSGSSFDSGDYIYQGNVESWRLFANSLKVKLGINLADINSTLAQSTIESAVTAGVITSNSQNATFNYTAAAPNYNPIYGELVASQRNDFVPASPIVDYMNTLNDPRRGAYFTQLGGTYVGGHYGYTNAYANSSHISEQIKAPDAPGIVFEATEVDFYLAEAAARGYNVGDNPESFYNKGIHDSFEFWGVAGADDYLAQPSVAYTTAAGTWQEKIGYQSWIAFFNRPDESWNSYRRLDYPQLVAPASAYPEAEGEVPKRMTYPIIEQTVNGDQYNAAAAAIGGDKLKTHVFWDVN